MELTKQFSFGYEPMIGVVLVAVLVIFLTNSFRDPLRKIPGPWYARWTDLVLKYHHISGTKPIYVLGLHKAYGPVVRISPTEVELCDPSAASVIHQVKQPFLKTTFYSKFIPNVENIFNTIDPDFHRRHRRLLSSPLSESQLKLFWPQIEQKVDLMIAQMTTEGATHGGVIDVYKWFLYMATDIIGELSFGESFHMLERNEVSQYVKDLKVMQSSGGISLAFPWLTSLALARLIPLFQQAQESQRRIHGYAKEALTRHRSLVESEGSAATPTLLSKLYKASHSDGDDNITAKELQDDAMAFIIAGSDSTANTLTYLVWQVCRRPDIQEKLVKELQSLPDGYSAADVKELPFLRLVAHEVMRVFPAAPGALPRYVPPQGFELAGKFLPGGSIVMTSAYSLHNDPTVFQEPEKFDPSRWENPTAAMKTSFMPFGGGTRTCVGVHLAWLELRVAAARFFRAFPDAKVSSQMTDEDMAPEMFFLTAPKSHHCLIQI